jgi:ParB-like chromosome segregation protein Spo0J
MTQAREACASVSTMIEPGARRLAVVSRPVAALRLDAKNPRRHEARQVAQIAASIRAFGFNVPVLIDAHDNVVAGHGRMLAAKQLGLDAVPTIRLDHLSAAQARAFMIADNRLAETSAWDDRLLAAQFAELSALDLDFDLEATGFTVGEIELRIEGANASESQALTRRPSAGDPGSSPGQALPRKGGGVGKARLSQREAALAEREAKLAELEARLAAWEANLVEREARLEAANA